MAAREKEMELAEKAMRELFTDIGAEITYIKTKVEEFTAEKAAAQPIPQRDSIKSDIPSEKKGGGEQKSETGESSDTQDTEWQKKCPMCGGRMNFHLNGEMWQCYSCAYEELKTDEVQGKSEAESEQTNAPEPTPASEPFVVPVASMSSNENQVPKKGSSPYNNQPSTKKKACPVCHKKMQWYSMEKAWRCPFCEYERRI
jgi:ribosomal protein L37AE/L43A